MTFVPAIKTFVTTVSPSSLFSPAIDGFNVEVKVKVVPEVDIPLSDISDPPTSGLHLEVLIVPLNEICCGARISNGGVETRTVTVPYFGVNYAGPNLKPSGKYPKAKNNRLSDLS